MAPYSLHASNCYTKSAYGATLAEAKTQYFSNPYYYFPDSGNEGEGGVSVGHFTSGGDYYYIRAVVSGGNLRETFPYVNPEYVGLTANAYMQVTLGGGYSGFGKYTADGYYHVADSIIQEGSGVREITFPVICPFASVDDFDPYVAEMTEGQSINFGQVGIILKLDQEGGFKFRGEDW